MLPDVHCWLMIIADSARTGGKWCDYGIIMKQGATVQSGHFTAITHQCWQWRGYCWEGSRARQWL